MENKTILFVLHNLYGGGAEKMMVRLANQFVQMKFNVKFVLISDYGVNFELLDKKISVECLNKKRTFLSIFSLAKYFYKNNYDVAISALTHVNVVSIIASFIAFKINKLFVSERNFFSLDRKVSKSFLMKMVYFLAPFMYRVIKNPVICVSNGVLSDLNINFNIPKKCLVVADNPTLDDDFISSRSLNNLSIHPWIKNKQKEKIIVAGGRLAHQKGFDVLLKAFSIVKDKIDSKLIIFGEGPLQAELEKLVDELNISDFVSMPGYSKALFQNFSLADLFVMSSRFEGSPNALVEAIASGVKVISTDCPHGPREILNDDSCLVEVGNIQNLSEAIIKSLNSEPIDLIPKVKRFTSTEAAKSYLNVFGLEYEI